jgi:glucose-1-phosphate cytidylyltransferase
MQVVILCGGQGTRIRDIADDIPKPMIPVGSRPILWHIMKYYAQFGFTEFILCLGHRGWVIKRFFLDYHLSSSDIALTLGQPEQVRVYGGAAEEKWQVTLAETGLDSMTGYRVKCIEKYITDENFFLTYGDGLGNIDLRQLLEFHRGHGKTATVTAVRPPSRFGEIDVNGTQVAEFSEKPLITRGRINGGFFVFHRRIFERLRSDPNLILEQGPLMQLARDGELMAHLHNGFWQPMDNSRDYKYLNQLWCQNVAPWNTWAAPPRRVAA